VNDFRLQNVTGHVIFMFNYSQLEQKLLFINYSRDHAQSTVKFHITGFVGLIQWSCFKELVRGHIVCCETQTLITVIDSLLFT
jgi:hypothetical protein